MATKRKKKIVKTSSDVLKILCDSIKDTLSKATLSDVNYSRTFIKTNRTCIRPDIGCFVLFDGGFTGLVAMNFTAEAALELYKKNTIPAWVCLKMNSQPTILRHMLQIPLESS